MSGCTKAPQLLTDYLWESIFTCLNNTTLKMINIDIEERSVCAYFAFSPEQLNFLPSLYNTQVI